MALPGAQNRPGGGRNHHDVRTLMLDFQVPRISTESVDDNRGSFTIEPLDRGFGYTFGNSLRRVLLSSLAGPGPRLSPSRAGAPRVSQRPRRDDGAARLV